MHQYVKEFLNFDCAGDVMNSVGPGLRTHEIIRAMAVAKRLRPLLVKYESDQKGGSKIVTTAKYNLSCVCDDDGFLAIFLAHIFRFTSVTAYSAKELHKNAHRVKNLYQGGEEDGYDLNEDSVLVSVGTIDYKKVVDAYNESDCAWALALPDTETLTGYAHNDDFEWDISITDRKILYLRETFSGRIYAENEVVGNYAWVISNLG